MKQKPGAKAHAVVCFDKETVSVSTVLGQMEVNESLQHRACLQGLLPWTNLGPRVAGQILTFHLEGRKPKRGLQSSLCCMAQATAPSPVLAMPQGLWLFSVSH